MYCTCSKCRDAGSARHPGRPAAVQRVAYSAARGRSVQGRGAERAPGTGHPQCWKGMIQSPRFFSSLFVPFERWFYLASAEIRLASIHSA